MHLARPDPLDVAVPSPEATLTAPPVFAVPTPPEMLTRPPASVVLLRSPLGTLGSAKSNTWNMAYSALRTTGR